MHRGERETAAWLKAVGFVPSRNAGWFISVTLYAPRGKKDDARCWIEVSPYGWSISLMEGERDYEWTIFSGERPSSEGSNVRLRPPKTLLDVPRWLAAVEKKRGLRFARDSAAIISTITGGKPVMSAWLTRV